MKNMRILIILATVVLAACGDDMGICGGDPPRSDVPVGHPLLNPDSPELKVVPPDSFDLRLETTAGDVVIRVIREWAPLGAYRFYNLARNGFYDESQFFRVLPGFAVQFGLSGRPPLDEIWQEETIPDDPPRVLNQAGTVAFAMAGPNTRTTQVFVNYGPNEVLDQQGFAPIGRVVEGMDVLFRLFSGYGEMQPQGTGPAYGCILSHGNEYLSRRYPELDRIESTGIIEYGEVAQ